MNRDPEIYGPDADHFNPARYLDGGGRLIPAPVDTKEEGHVTFGFGRRICPGRQVGNDSLFITFAVLLWALNFERLTDSYGKPAPLDLSGCIEDGLVVCVLIFYVRV